MDINTMRCSKYQRMIDLAIGGDLTPSAQSKLERHLSRCTTCSKEMQMARSMHNRITAIGTVNLKQPKPRITLDKVVGRLSKTHLPKSWSRLGLLIRSLEPLTGVKRFRLTFALMGLAAMVVLAILMALSIHRLNTQNKTLETSLASLQQQGREKSSLHEEEIFLKFIKSNLDDSALQKLKTLNQPFADNGDVVIVESQTLESLLSSLQESQRLNRLLIMRLLQRNPELREIEIRDGLNRSELKLLAKKRSQLAKLFGET